MSKPTPNYSSDDRAILDELGVPDKRVEYAKRLNRQAMEANQAEEKQLGVNQYLYGNQGTYGVSGGYLGGAIEEEDGGYLRASGGFAPLALLAPILTAVAPTLIDKAIEGVSWLGRKISGHGMGGRVIGGRMDRINTTGAGAFLHSLASEAIRNGVPEEEMRMKLEKLVGSKRGLSSVRGGSLPLGAMKLGHVVMPLFRNHLANAIKGTGLSPEDIMSHLEDEPEVDKMMNTSIDDVVKGKGIGTIFGKIWNGVKGLFNKAKDSGVLNKVANSVKEGATKAWEKHGDKLIEKGTDLAANKINDYLDKKMKGEEPELTATELKKLEEKLKQGKKEQALKDEIERVRAKHSKKYEEDDEIPSGKSDTKLRKKLVEERRKVQQEKRIIPKEEDEEEEEEEPKPKQMRVVGWNKGPVYGYGFKKKARGGAWSVTLSRN